MKLSKNINFQIVIEPGVNEATASLIGKTYCLPMVDIPYMSFKKAYADTILKIFECQKLIYLEEDPDCTGLPSRTIFRNNVSDEIHAEFKRYEATITIYSNHSDIFGRYKHKIETTTAMFKADSDGHIWTPWECFFGQNSNYSSQRGVLVPSNYEMAIPLDNYTESTRMQLVALEDILEKENYFGHIILLDGLPGTGKSYYIKRLVSKLHQSMKIKGIYYFIGDGINHLEIEHCLKHCLLIFEDADSVLGPKYNRNSNVTKILNFSSGFFDTKGLFVFSTNLENSDIDSAFMRDGRLLAHIEFGTFTREQGEQWLEVHHCKTKLENKPFTLANLYAIMNNYHKIEDRKKKSNIGFSTAEVQNV